MLESTIANGCKVYYTSVVTANFVFPLFSLRKFKYKMFRFEYFCVCYLNFPQKESHLSGHLLGLDRATLGRSFLVLQSALN